MENFVRCANRDQTHITSFLGQCANHYTTAPWSKCIKFASSNHSWQMVLQHVVITTVFSHCESATYTEQACCIGITLLTGPLHCQNFGKAFSSPKCELSYRLLPWNTEMPSLPLTIYIFMQNFPYLDSMVGICNSSSYRGEEKALL